MELLTLLDLFGVFVFALSGGIDATKYKLDVLGVTVLAIATGVGGGIVRDIVLGVQPPSVFVDQTYLFVCLSAAALAMFFSSKITQHMSWVRYADAIGLGIFAAIGASKALEHGLGWVGVIMISTMTAVGGGVIRDLLVREIPMILRKDFYASAAIIGAVTMLFCHHLHVADDLAISLSAIAAITARLVAMRLNYSLPKARG